MKSLPLALLLGLCGCAVTLAQQSPSSSGFGVAGMEPLGQKGVPSHSSTVVIVPPQACPVSMTAKQAGATEMVKVQKGPDGKPEPPTKPGQRIRLFLGGLAKTGKITATVTVRGLSARGRIDRAADRGDSPDLRRTLNVTFTREDENTVVTELVLPGFTAVKSVKLEALEFADGSTRDLAGVNMCTVAPDPMMLVAGR
jgi:hypothetical protein